MSSKFELDVEMEAALAAELEARLNGVKTDDVANFINLIEIFNSDEDLVVVYYQLLKSISDSKSLNEIINATDIFITAMNDFYQKKLNTEPGADGFFKCIKSFSYNKKYREFIKTFFMQKENLYKALDVMEIVTSFPAQLQKKRKQYFALHAILNAEHLNFKSELIRTKLGQIGSLFNAIGQQFSSEIVEEIDAGTYASSYTEEYGFDSCVSYSQQILKGVEDNKETIAYNAIQKFIWMLYHYVTEHPLYVNQEVAVTLMENIVEILRTKNTNNTELCIKENMKTTLHAVMGEIVLMATNHMPEINSRNEDPLLDVVEMNIIEIEKVRRSLEEAPVKNKTSNKLNIAMRYRDRDLYQLDDILPSTFFTKPYEELLTKLQVCRTEVKQTLDNSLWARFVNLFMAVFQPKKLQQKTYGHIQTFGFFAAKPACLNGTLKELLERNNPQLKKPKNTVSTALLECTKPIVPPFHPMAEVFKI